MSRKQLKAALDLVRRMPPAKQTKTLGAILALLPEEEFVEELLADVDQPLKERVCEKTQEPYLICEFNRDADAFRSPHSNEYYPSLEDGVKPPPHLRELEVQMNYIFGLYTKQYYGSEGVASVYVWDAGEPGAWACAVLIKKDYQEVGMWNSMHVVTVQEYPGDQMACYQLTTSILLKMGGKEKGAQGRFNFKLAGNVSKQYKQYDAFIGSSSDHVENIGNYIQHYENKVRGNLPDIYFGKAQQVVGEIHSIRAEGDGPMHMITMERKPKKRKVWRQYADDNGDVYWYNTVTGETQWEAPEDPKEYRKEKRSKKDKKKKKKERGEEGAAPAAEQNPMMGALAAAAMAAAQERAAHVDPTAEYDAAAVAAAPTEEASIKEKKKKEKKDKKEKAQKLWKKAKTDDGTPYWYNTETEETTWVKPAEPDAAPAEALPDPGASPTNDSSQPSPHAEAGGVPTEAAGVEDIVAWAATLGLSADYSEVIRANAIDGEVLHSLSADDVGEAMGISAFGDKRKMIKALGLKK
eukprot:TRINITY_DN6370_c1_g2_i1.p1 TRINITY_DN6370_c1_g2~~TRINITY_DN6370_c1_g2_i1.p1  ORF type:complete len:523 (+),score=210.96 TRINITY_DN6370_c1_g2_i1:75-1643(+)